MQPATLALCMIVKNEEQYLPYCLGCIYKYLDELIILDTGSTDKTLDICEGFCEKIPNSVLLKMDWKYDFSLARNISQGGAKSSHIIWLDGDEVLTDSGVRKTKEELIQDHNTDFWLMPRVNFWKDLRHMAWYPDSQYKIYRNTLGLKWQNKIHETIYTEQYHNRLKQTPFPLFHYAYVKDPEIIAEKMRNYIKIENPDLADSKIRECSTQHSFFKQELPEGVVPYELGQYPEIFNRLEVNNKMVKEKDGEVLVKFSTKKFASVDVNTDETDLNEKFKDKKVSIVIATYNKLRYVRECILSIYTHTKIPFEIVLVDNGSTENIGEFVELLKKSRDNITYIRFEKNLGFSQGYNEGIKKATGEFIVVLNNDTILSENFISKLLDVYYARIPFGDAGLIGPISNNNPSEHGSLSAPEGTDFEGYLHILKKLQKSEEFTQYVESSWMTGLCYLFHRSLLDELAQIDSPKTQGVLFEERLPIYHNDTELNWRIHHRLKKKLWIAKEAFLWHYGKVTVNTLTQDEFNEMKQDSESVLKELWPEIAGNMTF